MIQVDVLKKELEEAKKKIVLLTMKNDSLSGDFHDTAENASGAGKTVKFPLEKERNHFCIPTQTASPIFLRIAKHPGKKEGAK